MSDERPRKRLLTRVEVILLILAGIILLYFILKGVGLDPIQKTEDTEIADPYRQ